MRGTMNRNLGIKSKLLTIWCMRCKADRLELTIKRWLRSIYKRWQPRESMSGGLISCLMIGWTKKRNNLIERSGMIQMQRKRILLTKSLAQALLGLRHVRKYNQLLAILDPATNSNQFTITPTAIVLRSSKSTLLASRWTPNAQNQKIGNQAIYAERVSTN